MSLIRKAYPSDVSDDEWALVAPYLTLVVEDAGQREHPLREIFNGLRYVVKTGAPWRWMPKRPAALGGGLPAGSALARCGLFRASGRGPSRCAASGC